MPSWSHSLKVIYLSLGSFHIIVMVVNPLRDSFESSWSSLSSEGGFFQITCVVLVIRIEFEAIQTTMIIAVMFPYDRLSYLDLIWNDWGSQDVQGDYMETGL